MTSPTVAVIGAGVSGATCARRLAQHGVRVSLFDKGRGPGGRASTRRADGFELDHGAPYFTVSHPEFERTIGAFRRRGLVARWPRAIYRLHGTRRALPSDQPRGFVAVPRMSALVGALLAELDVQQRTHVARLRRDTRGWTPATAADEPLGRYDAAVVATPPTQAVALLEHTPQLASHAAQIDMTPCWALMLAFDRALPVPYDAAFVEGSPLSWIARNNSKPGRARAPETWVAHASAAWSADHLALTTAAATAQLLGAFHEATGCGTAYPRWQAAHRWRYARATERRGSRSLYEPSEMIGVCGDWLTTSRIEGAFLSGLDLADRMLRDLGITPDSPVVLFDHGERAEARR